MNKVFAAAFISALLISAFAATSFINLAKAQNDSGGENASDGLIISPISHGNYTTNLLTLKVTLLTVYGPDYYYYIVYSIDGRNYIRIPQESISYNVSHGILTRNTLIATVTLPPLNDGHHTLTVNAKEPYIIPGYTGDVNYQDTIDFTTHTPPPVIANLSIKNETYKQNSQALNFTTDKPTSWMAYSLDGQHNATIHGNTTLNGLANGEHTLTVYANSTFGSMGKSETAHFIIAKETAIITREPEPEPFPTTLVAVSVVLIVAAVGLGLLVYFKKRNH
jgi:hypothetical protein